jgi:hypothetical protein
MESNPRAGWTAPSGRCGVEFRRGSARSTRRQLARRCVDSQLLAFGLLGASGRSYR